MDKRSDYLYELPEELIAQKPADKRDSSRLIVLDRKTGKRQHKTFSDIIDYFNPGDVLVINDTKVIPARLNGKRPSGGQIELLLLEDRGDHVWLCLAKPAKRLNPGEKVLFEQGWEAEILEIGDEGRRLVRFSCEDDIKGSEFKQWLDIVGSMPLPPYIKRHAELEDKNRYQTVYAREDGAVAAPTAGLHFTDEILKSLEEKGVDVVRITLHVGIGTFRPVVVETITDHKMDYERYIVTEDAAERINRAKKNGGRLVAVGTTVVRTMESVCDRNGLIQAEEGATNIFLYPPYKFKAVDALITNFHLPGSTLIMLVSALAGRELMLETYNEAVEMKYRFFSYGDVMMIC